MTNKQAYAGLPGELHLIANMNAQRGDETAALHIREAAEAISSLLKALEPFAEAYRQAEPYRDFDGRDCREGCVINAVSLSDFEAAYAALSGEKP